MNEDEAEREEEEEEKIDIRDLQMCLEDEEVVNKTCQYDFPQQRYEDYGSNYLEEARQGSATMNLMEEQLLTDNLPKKRMRKNAKL